MGGWLARRRRGVQHRGGAPTLSTVLVGLHAKARRRVTPRLRQRLTGVSSSSSSICSKRTSRTSARVAEDLCGRRPAPSRSRRHPEGRPRHVLGDRPATAARRCRPRPARRAAPAPRAAVRARPAAGVPRRCWRLRLVGLTIAVKQQLLVRPRRQRRIHQLPGGIQHREVHRGAGAVQLADKPRSPCGSGCSRRMPARAATDMSRLWAVCSTAWVSSGCGDSSAKTR